MDDMELYKYAALREVAKQSENWERVYTLKEIKRLIKPIAEGCGIGRLTLIGSYARDARKQEYYEEVSAAPEDDIDLVIWDRGNLLSLCEFQLFLTQLFGKIIDLHLPFEFMGERYKYIKGEEILLYQRKRNRVSHKLEDAE
jgi:predicted nucleotidyltransferase